MKIGILTLPFHTNYGGIIQAYALQTVLKNMNHEVYIINRNIFELPKNKKLIIYAKRFLKKIFFNRGEIIFLEKKKYKEYLMLSVNIRQFVDTYFDNIINVKDYSEVKNKFDAIVVGSDQIWRALYLNPIENGYLKFSEKWKIKRISYATSFGSDVWSYTPLQTQNCKTLIKKFDAVSVREKSGVELCEKYYNINATHVLDPTMLLPVKHYISIINHCKNKDKIAGELFAYILQHNDLTDSYLNRISNILKYKPYYASTDRRDVELEKRKTVKMETWLNQFYGAKIVITDSFHACVFSILFKKPFYVLLNNDGNERISSLLKMFDIENRIITNTNFLDEQKLNSEIDWNHVEEVLESQKKQSLDFLHNSLRN